MEHMFLKIKKLLCFSIKDKIMNKLQKDKKQETETFKLSEYKIDQQDKDFTNFFNIYMNIDMKLEFASDLVFKLLKDVNSHEVEDLIHHFIELKTLTECYYDIFMKQHNELTNLSKGDDHIPSNISKKYPILN